MPSYTKALTSLTLLAASVQNGLAATSDPCTILTESIFNTIAPSATFPYTYSGFCSAVSSWNTNYPSNQIFMGGSSSATVADQTAELAAFFGNIRHESDDLMAPREYYMCQTQTTVNGKTYCKPSNYSGGNYNDPYCSLGHSPSTNPAGCNCGSIPPSTVAPGYLDADKLFLGRGGIQLSWNYNYWYAGEYIGRDLCTNPELVATDEDVMWQTVFWFWTSSTGSTGTTCKEFVDNGSFGGTVKTINGGLECPAASSHYGSVIGRLNDYCLSASALSVGSLLSLGDCSGLQSTFDACKTAGSCPACNSITSTPSPPTPPQSPPPPAPSNCPADSGICGPNNPCSDGSCCSQWGYCGTDENYCGTCCQSNCWSNTDQPTSEPTTSPPSLNPTPLPTTAPVTSAPTPLPTLAPTAHPTEAPTEQPTNAPTTSSPTKSPTDQPTSPPTTPIPTQPPTQAPTAEPTKVPSDGPTNNPTTSSPTDAPTTASPTKSPTAQPTNAPTTASPTQPPTAQPTNNPTVPPPTPVPTPPPTNQPIPGSSGWYVGVDGDKCVLGESVTETLYSSASACCSARLSWMSNELCVSRSTGVPTRKFYADQVAGVCRQDCSTGEGLPCGGSPKDLSSSLYSSLESCCTTGISWEPACVDKSNGEEPQGTGLYYVSWTHSKCALDCPEGSATGCGGVKNSWDATFATSAACCSTISWQPDCVYGATTPTTTTSTTTTSATTTPVTTTTTTTQAPPIGSTTTTTQPPQTTTTSTTSTTASTTTATSTTPGSSGWYVDEDKCTFGQSTGTLYTDASACCTNQLSWMSNEMCVSRSTGVSSRKFYADQVAGVCKQDCPSGEGLPCGGSPTELSSTLYSSLESCCTSKISWEPACVDKSNGDEPQGTGEYYVNWTYGDCVRDCPLGSDTGCGGVKNSWDASFATSVTCCSTISWKTGCGEFE